MLVRLDSLSFLPEDRRLEPKLHPMRWKNPMRTRAMLAAIRIAASAALVGVVFAQGRHPATSGGEAAAQEQGTMLLQARLGSFALEGEGRIEIKFRGTLLLHRFEGPPPVFEGNVRKEYEGHNRIVWFGQGRAVIEGKWRHLQWFGGDLEATWRGRGLGRLFGEFDPATGETGRVKVDLEKTAAWFTSGSTVYVPMTLHPGWSEIKRRRDAGLPEGPNQPKWEPEPMRPDWFTRR